MRRFLPGLALLLVAVVPGLGLMVTPDRTGQVTGALALLTAICAVLAGFPLLAPLVQALCLAFAVVRTRSHG